MKEILVTRLIHWKKQKISLLFWILFPVIATAIVMMITESIQEETKIPVGVVLEENTMLSEELYESIVSTPFIRAYSLNEKEALNKLQKHELDSVFIIRKGYEESIRKGSRNQLIKGYESDLSLAYSPASEMVTSYVQQDAGRSKAAYVVQQLKEFYHVTTSLSWDELVANSKEIEEEQNLLQTTLTFLQMNERIELEGMRLFKPWNLWALFSLLATLLLFDWVIKEKEQSILPRFVYTRISFKNYLLKNFFVYTILLFLADIITMFVFQKLFNEPIYFSFIISLLFYRLLITIGAFLLALLFNNTYVFYAMSFVLTLFLALSSGALLPIDHLIGRFPWITLFNPLQSFLSGQYINIWFILFSCLLVIWFLRKGESHA